MTRLILVRHGPTADTGKRLTGRLPGVALTPAGHRAAAALARSLGEVPLVAVYTSPALRCRETAALLAEPHGLRPRVYPRLADTDYGSWSGRSLAVVRRTTLWRLVEATPSRVRFPDGEALTEVQARAIAACEALTARHPDATLAVVTHADIIGTALAHYLGMPLDLYRRLTLDPAAATTFERPADGPPRVRGINLRTEAP